MTGEFDDPAWTALAVTNFGRVTPEWEMKSESLVAKDGAFDWTRADRLVSLVRIRHGLKVHGHALVWYFEAPDAFATMATDRKRFADAYRTYILGVAGRYRGQLTSWDVVNEPFADDGSLRDCLWRRVYWATITSVSPSNMRKVKPIRRRRCSSTTMTSRPSPRNARRF